VAGCCEHGDEPSGSIKGGEFHQLSILLRSQEGSCFMERVNLRNKTCVIKLTVMVAVSCTSASGQISFTYSTHKRATHAGINPCTYRKIIFGT
jgi:hypothetical protein